MLLLALDIETLGLLEKKPLPAITCACLFDGTHEYKLQFYGNDSENTRDKNIEILLNLLDSADRLIGYNAVLFDLEFIKQSFRISDERMSSWIRKTIDPYMYLKFILQCTSSLSALLKLNHLPSKTGSGTQAVSLALQVQTLNFLAFRNNDKIK